MLNSLPLDRRAAAYLALVQLAPSDLGPERTRFMALAELLTLRHHDDDDPHRTPAMLQIMAQEVRAAGDVAAGRHGHAIYTLDGPGGLARLIGSRRAAITVLRLAGASNVAGQWIDKEFSESDGVVVTFGPDFFADLATYLVAECENPDTE